MLMMMLLGVLSRLHGTDAETKDRAAAICQRINRIQTKLTFGSAGKSLARPRFCDWVWAPKGAVVN